MGRRADFHNEREPGLLGIQPGTVLAGASADAINLAGMRFVNEGLCEIIVPVGNSHSYMLVVQPCPYRKPKTAD